MDEVQVGPEQARSIVAGTTDVQQLGGKRGDDVLLGLGAGHRDVEPALATALGQGAEARGYVSLGLAPSAPPLDRCVAEREHDDVPLVALNRREVLDEGALVAGIDVVRGLPQLRKDRVGVTCVEMPWCWPEQRDGRNAESRSLQARRMVGSIHGRRVARRGS